MNSAPKFNVFSEGDRSIYTFTRKWREKLVRPLVEYLGANDVKPNTLSYLALGMMVPFVFFFSFNPWIALGFLVLNQVLDSLDGSLARYLKKDSEQGAFIDATFDYLSFYIVFLVFVYYGMLSPFWGAIFLLNNAILISFIVFASMKRMKLFPTFRPRLFIYLTFIIWILTGFNYFDPVVLLSSVYMIITNIFIYYKIVCSL